jgi:hypothetical protein
MPADLSDALLRHLSPAQVRWYAILAGWRPVDGVKRPVFVLNHPTDDLTQIQVPTAGSEKEVGFLMGEAVRQLAAFEQRPAREVLADLSLPPADVLRLRVESREAESGTVPLDEGLRLFQAGRDLLLAAACSAHQPQAYFRSQSYAPAQEYLRSCRLGQTEAASFAATIVAPVTPELAPSLFDALEAEPEPANEPYERRVTLLLMQALQTLRVTLDHGRSEELLRSVPQGVSANLCDALASMCPADVQATLHVSITWSRNRARVPRRISNRVAFAQSEFAILREAGRRLKNIESRRVHVEGPILILKAEPAQLFEEFRGGVTIRTLIDGRSASVRFHLNQSEYAQACDAHRDRRHIAVSGMLHGDAQTRVFDLLVPQDFRVLPGESLVGEGNKQP